MPEAVGYDAQGNEIDSAGNIIPVESFEDPAYTDAVYGKSAPAHITARRREGFLSAQEEEAKKQERIAYQQRRAAEVAARNEKVGRENRAARIAQVRERGTPAEVAAVIESEIANSKQDLARKKRIDEKKAAETAARDKRVDEQQTKKDAEQLRLTKAEYYLDGLDSGITGEEELKEYVNMRLSEKAGVLASFPKEDRTEPAIEGAELSEEDSKTLKADAAGYDAASMLREQFDYGMVEADRAQKAFDAMQENQRISTEQVRKEMASAENDLKNYTIDPGRAFSSTGRQIAAAFAVALGSFAEGLSGGKLSNSAFAIVDNAIKRDIEAQKMEMNKYSAVLKNKNNVFARMLQRFGNERAAYVASMQLGLSAAGASIDELAAKFPPGSKQAELAAGFKARLAGQYAKGLTLLEQIQSKRLRSGKSTSETKGLFENALREVDNLRDKFKAMGAGEAAFSYLMGAFGPEAQVTFSDDTASEYSAARYAVAQFVNKAFSGARGSDRDLAAVMARIPQALIASMDREKGLKLIQQLEDSLKAAAGEKGYLEKGDIARYWDKHGGKAKTDRALVANRDEIDALLEQDS